MLKVVVADDEARVCQLILMLADWESLGMEVVGVAANGLEALELVEWHHPDLLITDIRMPGCHGLDLIQRAKGKFSELEIVIISGYAQFGFAQTAIKYGVGDYLLKPIKREELMATLEKLGQRCRQRGQSVSEVEQLRQSNQENVDQLRLPLDIFNQRLEAVTEEGLWATYRFRAEPGLYQIALLKVDDPAAGFSSATMDIIEDKTVTIFRHELRSVCEEPLMAFQGSWGCCLLSFAAKDQDDLRKHLRSCLDQLARAGQSVPHLQGWEMLELVVGAGCLFLLRPELEDRERLQQEFEADCDRCGRTEQLFQCLSRLQREQLEAIRQRRHNDSIRPIRMAKQYVQAHYSEPITLEDVCEVVGFSSSYFSALFKKETGEGFAKYLTRVRMERARELLQQTSLPVSEICVQVGYSDLKHFTQNFKKETNLNPGQYRKLYG